VVGDDLGVENLWQHHDPRGSCDGCPLVYKLPDREKPILDTLSKD